MQMKFLCPIAVLAIAAAGLFAQSAQTITGTITDSMCGTHHMMKNATPAQCTRDCVKQGSDYALASGNKVYTLKGDKVQFNKLAGQNVVIKGTTEGTTITVASIKAAK